MNIHALATVTKERDELRAKLDEAVGLLRRYEYAVTTVEHSSSIGTRLELQNTEHAVRDFLSRLSATKGGE